jgi:twinkle protein
MLSMMAQHRVAIASLEMPPEQTINRMIRQVSGTVDPTDEYKMSFMDWANSRLFIYDAIERVQPESLLGMAMYCRQELNVQHLVIDSLTKAGISKDDLSRQATFVDDLQNIAKNTGLHIHLVSHIRKGDGSTKHAEPDKESIRGSGEVTDLADSVWLVCRNKYKDELKASGITTVRDKEGNELEVEKMIDTKLKLVKNRQTGVEGSYKLWRHPSGQYTDVRGQMMRPSFQTAAEKNVQKYKPRG